MYDHHVQAWCRDRVKVLTLLAELARLDRLAEARDRSAKLGYEWTFTRRRDVPKAYRQTITVKSL